MTITTETPRRRLDRKPQLRLSLLMVIVAVAGFAIWAWKFHNENNNVHRSFVHVQIWELKNGDARARWTAAEQLGFPSIDELPSALTALVNAARDPDPKVREAITKSLATAIAGHAKNKGGNVTAEIDAALPPLLAALVDADSGVRAEAARAIGELHGKIDGLAGGFSGKIVFGPEADRVLPPLIKALADPEATVRANAAHAIGRDATKKLDAPKILMTLLKHDPNTKVREEAGLALCKPWKNADSLWAPLAAIALAPQPGDSAFLTWAIPELGTPPSSMFGPLCELLATDTFSARNSIPIALERLGSGAAPALPALLKVARIQLEKGENATAVQAIAHIGPDSPEAMAILPELAARLFAPDRRATSFKAGQLIAMFGPHSKAIVPLLITVADAKVEPGNTARVQGIPWPLEDDSLQYAANALYQIAPNAKPALPALARHATSGLEITSPNAVAAIIAIDRASPEALGLLLPLAAASLQDKPFMASGLDGWLSQIVPNTPSNLPALREAAESGDDRRMAAAKKVMKMIKLYADDIKDDSQVVPASP